MPRELSKGGQRPTVKLSVWSHGRQKSPQKEALLFKHKLSIWDMIGSGSKYALPEEMRNLLDDLRAEDE
jgi:hypothetical protein